MPGCEPDPSLARNWLAPPSSPPHYKDPQFFHPKGGPPLGMEEQGGGPQDMAFVRASAGWFRAKMPWRGGAEQAPTTSLPQGNVPTLQISG